MSHTQTTQVQLLEKYMKPEIRRPTFSASWSQLHNIPTSFPTLFVNSVLRMLKNLYYKISWSFAKKREKWKNFELIHELFNGLEMSLSLSNIKNNTPPLWSNLADFVLWWQARSNKVFIKKWIRYFSRDDSTTLTLLLI